MKKKFFNIMMFFIITMFVSGTTVFAEEILDKTGAITKGNFLYYKDGSLVNTDTNPATAPEYPIFVYKYSDNGSFICATGMDVEVPEKQSCEISTHEKSTGVAYLINKYTNSNQGSVSLTNMNQYYWLELAVLKFVGGNIKVNGVINNTAFDNLPKPLVNDYEFNTLQSEAADYYSQYSNAKYGKAVSISLSSSNLEFTYNGDGNFYSQKVYITDTNANSDEITITPSDSTFELIDQKDTKGRYFQLKIHKSKVAAKTLSVSVTVTGKHEYYTANFYDCATNQDLFSTVTNLVSKTGAANISGEVSSTQLTIKKLDEKDKFLPGVTIKIENEDKSYSETRTTTDKEIVLENLAYGKYTITEVSSPEGYTLLKEPQTVTLSKDNLSATVTLKNSLTKVEISKLDYKSGDFLPGALLQIQDKEGNVVKDKSGKEYEWISTDKVYVIDGLPVGTYYLVEKSSPDKYVLNGKKVEFKVTNDSKETKVVMTNKLNKVKISKINIVDKKELKGATLEIQDKDGNIVKYCTDSEGKENTECKWVSTDKPYEIEGMPNGTYYLVETIAPEGYVLNKEKIEFVVDGKELIVEVEMENELEVKVPDTLSSRSTLLIAISMFDIALGIGILTYVKKNKAEE